MKFVVIMAAVALVLPAAVAKANTNPVPLDPSMAKTDATTGDGVAVSNTMTVPQSDAVQAAQSTDGSVSVEGAPVPAPPVITNASYLIGQQVCWYKQLNTWHGTWPYNQDLHEDRYVCAYYGKYIYYRVSHAYGGGFICDWSNAYAWRVAGGVGFYTVTVKTGAHYTCQSSIPWFPFHADHWQIWTNNSVGGFWLNSNG